MISGDHYEIIGTSTFIDCNFVHFSDALPKINEDLRKWIMLKGHFHLPTINFPGDMLVFRGGGEICFCSLEPGKKTILLSIILVV